MTIDVKSGEPLSETDQDTVGLSTPRPDASSLGMSDQATTWRDTIEVHPAADMFPMLSEDELKVLGEDIKANGLRVRVVFWTSSTGKRFLLDGRNRLDAIEAVGLDPNVFISTCRPLELTHEVDPYEYVVSVNLRRRHLTSKEKRGVIAELLKAKPEWSDRQIAKLVGGSHPIVARVRKSLEQSGDVENFSTRTDTRGRKQPAKKPKPAKSVKPTPAPNPTPGPTSAKSGTSLKNAASALNSLSWSEASLESRRKFIEAVGPKSIWEAAPPDYRSAFIEAAGPKAFIDAFGPTAILDAMTEQQRDALIQLANRQEAHKRHASNESQEEAAVLNNELDVLLDQIENVPPGEMPHIPKFLDRRNDKTPPYLKRT